VIKGTLTYDETHEPGSGARAVVVLVDMTAGPNQGTVIASTSIKDPGPQPIKFELAYPFSVVDDKNAYQLFAGIVDGDLAWASATGTPVPVPQPEVSGIKLVLEYRPDLLKGAVTGSITGVGLDPARSPDAYGTSLLIDVNTGQTIGFQLIEPVGAVPVPFSVPFDPGSINPNASYVARGSVWDGTTLWNTPVGAPVITDDNPKSNVLLTVVPAGSPVPPPTPAAPTASPAPPTPSGDSGLGTGAILALLLLIGAGIVGAVLYTMRRRQAAEADAAAAGGPERPPSDPEAPPPPPGPEPTEPPPPPGAATGAEADQPAGPVTTDATEGATSDAADDVGGDAAGPTDAADPAHAEQRPDGPEAPSQPEGDEPAR
jgi:uncharacterized lipoprotein YbaY